MTHMLFYDTMMQMESETRCEAPMADDLTSGPAAARPRRKGGWPSVCLRVAVFVVISALIRAGEHYALYDMHPTVHIQQVASAVLPVDAVDPEAVRLYESCKNATIAVSGGAIALTGVTLFGGYIDRSQTHAL